MTERTMKALADLAQRYAAHGITLDALCGMMATLPDGYSEAAGVAGIRMALGHEYNVPEYFDIETVCEITGMTKDEALAALNNNGAEIITDVHFGAEPPES